MPAREVHVWIAALDAVETSVRAALLGPDELARASRLRDAADRERYVAAHCTQRRLLAEYVAEAPEQLRFRSGPRGKPELLSRGGASAISFNLSHPRSRLAVAVAETLPVGIDIEEMEPTLDVDELTRSVLSPPEQTALAAMPPARRRRAFYTAWVCKEAVLKAAGRGLSEGVKEVRVPAEALVAGENDGSGFDFVTECERAWRVRSLPLAGDCVGAVAAPNLDWTLHCFTFEAAGP